MALNIKKKLIPGGMRLRNRTSDLQIGMGKPDYWLLAIVATILVLGTVMVYSASFVTAESNDLGAAYYLWRHLLWLVIGFAGAAVLSIIDYHHLRRYSTPAMGAVMFLLVLVLFLPETFSPTRFGAKRWLSPLGGSSDFSFQPSELCKVILIIYAAHWLTSKGDKVRTFLRGVIPFAITVGAVVGLVLLEPDMGTALIISSIGIFMFFIAGSSLLHMIIFLTTATGASYALITFESYRASRLQAFFDPFADPSGNTLHTFRNLVALGGGGIFGTGLGASRQKFMWLPNVFTDSIFAVIGEELGLVGASLTVLLFVALAWRGMRIAAHAPDHFGRLIASGATIYIVVQAFLNMAVITNLVPFTGIPLPLISYGGTSLSVTLLAIGLLVNVSRQQISDPRLLMAEEMRVEERRRRELLREQRQADRERREAQHKLQEAERHEKEREELSAAAKRWHEERAKQREAQYWEEHARQAQERRKARAESNAARRREEEMERQAELQPEEAELPPEAVYSFKSYQVGTPGKVVSDGTGQPKPSLRKPRRDWAKVYEARRNRKD
ncbi:MAG TPA: putative lipid II flippase FtsW [Chloroflexia bacterium]|nr:putative lipid II flippase FtsW [Chloroflexia bacterium]